MGDWRKAMTLYRFPGTKRRTYLEDNLGAVNINLTADDLSELNGWPPPCPATRYPAHTAKRSNAN